MNCKQVISLQTNIGLLGKTRKHINHRLLMIFAERSLKDASAHIVPKQRKSQSSQRTTVPPTTAQSNSLANSADAVQTTQYAAMPAETLCFFRPSAT
ncbi:uncharacterized protein [Montipora capricornis]|uniref:uncharacterized protein isoform X4 n=1 Tax=Montipora capricornis TaxID=246305 RepID=UPI0035F0FAFD